MCIRDSFYTPLLLAVELGSTDQSFMKSMSEDFECSYSVAEYNENVYEKISNGEIDIAQSSVSGSWNNKYSKDIVHFAEINKMDGFHLVQRSDNEIDEKFDWEILNQKEILVDHSTQPLYMFKYACSKKNIDFLKALKDELKLDTIFFPIRDPDKVFKSEILKSIELKVV